MIRDTRVALSVNPGSKYFSQYFRRVQDVYVDHKKVPRVVTFDEVRGVVSYWVANNIVTERGFVTATGLTREQRLEIIAEQSER